MILVHETSSHKFRAKLTVKVANVRGDLLTFGEESEMDFDVVFVDFLAEEKYFLAPLHWAGVVAVVEDLKV